MVTLPTPHNDAIKSRDQLSRLRSLLRLALDRIKAAYSQSTVLHVFPAAAISVAVEFGRVRMPKADMPWLIYDQVNARGGFIPALSIPEGERQ
jgi:allophanate hydrolase subunit 2